VVEESKPNKWGYLSNVRCKTSRTFRNKGDVWGKIELETSSKD